MRTLRGSVAGAGGYWFMVAQALVGGSTLVFHILVSRLLGPAAYGAFGSLLALLVLMTVPAGGLQTMATARTARLIDERRSPDGRVLFARAMTVGALCAAVMLAAAPWLRALLHLDSTLPVVLLALYCLPLAAVIVPWGLLCGRRLFLRVGMIAIGATVVRTVAAMVFIDAGLGVSGAVGASLVADSLQALALYLAADRLRPRPGEGAPAPLRVDVRAAGTGVIAFVGLWLFAGIDTIVARLLFAEVPAGRYSAAATALHGVLYGGQAIALVALPSFAAADRRRARRALRWALLAAAIVTVPSVAVLAGVGTWLIPAIFGPTFEVDLTVLAPVAVATTGIAMLWMLTQYNIAQGGRGAFAAWAGLPVAVLGAACWHAELWQLASVMIVAALPSLLIAARWAFGAPAAVTGAAAPVGLPAPAEPVDLTVVVPFYNPGPALRRNVLRLVGELSGYGVSFEVIAVDDGSDDGSAASVADLDGDRVRLLSLPHNQGKGAALRHGLRAGNGRYLGFIDADGDLDPTLWRSFVSLIQLYEPDGIVGDKCHPLTAIDSAAAWTRNVCSYGYRGLVRLLFPALPVRDTQVGLKVFRRDVLSGVLPYCIERRFVLGDVELLALANRLGYRRILPAPVSLYRVDRSMVTPRVLVRIFADTLALAWRFHCSDRYPPAVRPAGTAAVPHAGAQPAVPLSEVV